jgi:hypothetical protein
MDLRLLLLLIVAVPPWKRPPTDQPEPPPQPVEDRAEPSEESEPLPLPEPPPPAPGLFVADRPIDVGPLPPGLANLSAQSCAACHISVHTSWQGGAHHQGWQDPLFLEAARATGDAPMCMTCHLPLVQQQPVQLQEYLGGELTRARLRENPSWDPTLQQEGVTCAACHVREGTVIGVHASPQAPHPVAVSTELTQSAFCAPCHQLAWPGADQPFYDTYGEWERSPYAYAGVRCQDCHMAPVAGIATAGRFAGQADHAVALDPARAVSVLVSLPASTAVRGHSLSANVRVQNTGAGHAFPTGSPFAHVLLLAEFLDSEGALVGEALSYALRRQVTAEPPYNTIEDTRLAAGGEILLEHEVALSQKAAPGLGMYRVTLSKVRSDGTVEAPFLSQEIPMILE